MPDAHPFSAADRAQLAAAGIALAEAERQLRLLREPPATVVLDRPCRIGDGIEPLAAPREGEATAFEAERDGPRLCKFVPASGAASRMFDPLLRPGAARERLLENIHRLPFFTELAALLEGRGRSVVELAAQGCAQAIARALLDAEGLDYTSLPKALIPFHATPAGARTPLEEHLHEAATLVAGQTARVHFTVDPQQRRAFQTLLAEISPRLEASLAGPVSVELSVQSEATQTLAIDPDGEPFRKPNGTLLLRPGGHGALVANLAALAHPLVLIKNIDNVLPAERQSEAVDTKRCLLARLLQLEVRQHELQRRLEATEQPPSELVDAALLFLAETGDEPVPGATAAGARRRLLDRLYRPLRVCGVVVNTGEPGGGPFWVRDACGRVSKQIVETSQIAANEPEQARVARLATHFNPVELVASLRDHRGESYPLERFVDPTTSFVARKRAEGRELVALERPGLWNGAMAGWLTVFVEIPAAVFTPVKTVLDLLRPEHQPDPAPGLGR